MLPTETNIVWLDLDAPLVSKENFTEVAADHGVRVMMKGRLAIHHQISEDAIQLLTMAMRRVLGLIKCYDEQIDARL